MSKYDVETQRRSFLMSFAVYIAGLTASCYLLLFIFVLVPANRHRSFIFLLNLILLLASIIDFSTAIFMFYGRVENPERQAPFALVVCNSTASSISKTIAEAILLLRVKVVFPGHRLLLVVGTIMIVTRTVCEITGKLLFVQSNYENYKILIAGPALEILNNIGFSVLFLYRLKLNTQSKVLKSKFIKMRTIAIENWLLPTAFSIFATAMIAIGSLPSGYQAGTAICYVVSIPLATMWTVGDSTHSESGKTTNDSAANNTNNSAANQLEYCPESSDSLLDQTPVMGLSSNTGAICLAEIAPWTTSDYKCTRS